MNAEEVKLVLEAYLRATEKDIRIFYEKKIGSAICDVMAVTDKLVGFEIKSDLDNYERLSEQIKAYDLFFDKNYIVVGKKHFQSASEKVPAYWGIICISESNVQIERKAKINRGAACPRQLSVLWKIELKNLLVENNLPMYALKTKGYLIDKLTEHVPTDKLKKQIVAELKGRDYSLLNDDDNEQDFVGIELLDGLSEQDFSALTLDKWIALYNRAKAVSEKKESVFENKKTERTTHEITYKDIEVSLGVPWISSDIINDFVWQLLELDDTPPSYLRDFLIRSPKIVNLETVTGNWFIENKGYIGGGNRFAEEVYGIKRYNALYIIEALLNLREIKLYDGKNYNEADTLAALEKQKLISEKFKEWIWLDEDRIWEIEEAYNAMFAGLGNKVYDGSNLKFIGMNEEIRLHSYQKDAVQKIISTPNTLLAFDVGAGKTFIMIAAAMQMRQSGLSRKNVFVVPNNIVGQWELMFTTLYPESKILTVEPKTYRQEMRSKVLKQIKEGDYDGIIIAYSCFELMDLSSEYIAASLQEKLKILDSAIKSLTKNGVWQWGQAPLDREKKYLQGLATQLIDEIKAPANEISFDSLEINTLFVDEAHNFKNIPLKTALKNLRGINTQGSKKCLDMLEKVRCVQMINGGRGVVFATGTPICNSLSDAFAMQTYLQYDLLHERHLDRFDNWVKTFACPEQVCEIDVDTSKFRFVNRFVKFFNLPELSKLFSESTAFYANNETDLPQFDDYNDEVLYTSSQLKEYMQTLCERSEKVRAKEVDRSKDNMLKISIDGRKAALDLTLVDSVQPYDETSKVFRCVKNVVDIYRKFDGCSQLIFCDYSTPKGEDFSVYRELKRRLIDSGIPENEIAFVHSCKSEETRLKLYENVNAGKVRILIGSTFKLGTGANVQTKLKAVHHLDVPWRPADMVQREGRILRRGNENKEVNIFRYISEGSFDAYSWQILETKQRFISQFLNGTAHIRSASDLENSVLSYAEVKALALSEPKMKFLAEKENELRNARVLYMRECEQKEKIKVELPCIEQGIADYEEKYNRSTQNGQYVKGLTISREQLRTSCENVTDNVLFVPDKELCTIYGFSVMTPTRQSQKKPYVKFCLNGVSYAVEVGTSMSGNVTRISNFFARFDEYTKKIYEILQTKKQERESALRIMALPSEYENLVKRLECEKDKILEQMRSEAQDD